MAQSGLGRLTLASRLMLLWDDNAKSCGKDRMIIEKEVMIILIIQIIQIIQIVPII